MMKEPVIDSAHQVVPKRGLFGTNVNSFGQKCSGCYVGVCASGQFVQHTLAKLENWNVIDVLPNPIPMLSSRPNHVLLLFQFTERRNSPIGLRKLLLKDERVC